jgi:hypothetical protein
MARVLDIEMVITTIAMLLGLASGRVVLDVCL